MIENLNRHQRVRALFEQISALPAPARAAALAEACVNDDSLHDEVARLLAADAAAGSFLERGVALNATDSARLIGQRVGPYEIQAVIGVGGMGEVYRARDTILRRDVALKILPDAFDDDADRVARFRREAQILASLNHPHIAAIYGFEESDSGEGSGLGVVRALVLELVDGPTLADRIAEGPLPVDEVVSIARQICEALELAHEQGIVHRDLKPANIKVRPDGAVKVLDFGLAKALEPTTISGSDVTASPTITSPALTRMGVILGTAAYMSPEAARGRAADKRSDVWAFGCVLFEMLTGRRLFEGETISDTLASVLKTDPDWTRLPAETPASIRRLLRRCLEKDRTRRLDSAAAARLEIDDALAAPAADSLPVVTPPRMRAWPMGLALVGSGALVAALISWALTPRAPSADPATRLSATLEPGVHLGEAAREALYQQRPGLTAFALSPDGRQLVYVGHDGKTSQLYVRHLDRDRAVAIAGTTGAQSPFFSPDGRDVGFFIAARERRDAEGAVIGTLVNANGAIRRVAIAGGAVRTVEISGPAASVFPSATWSADDTILLSGSEGIYRVPASGGTIERLIAAAGVRFPELLPGGRAILFNVSDLKGGLDVAVETLDTHERTLLVRGGSFPRFVTSGHLVFARSGKIMAVAFDPVTRTTSGDPVVVGEDVMLSAEGVAYFRENGTAQFAVSRSGNLAYVPGGVYAAPKHALTLVDRKGAASPLPLSPASMFGATISPDGKRIAWAQASSSPKTAIWLLDVERGVSRRLTEEDMYLTPVWSPDGTRLAARVRGNDGSFVLAVVDVDRGGAPQQRSLDGSGDDVVYWAPTNHLFLLRITSGAPGRLATLALDGPSQVRPLFEWSTQMYYAVFSRDGKWMSYSLNETGAPEVYVRPVPAGAPVTRVSVNGGSSSAWSADGRELFYREGSRMMAVPISTATGFRLLGPPRELFSGDYLDGQQPSRGFEVTSDGRFLLKTRVPAPQSAPVTSINVALNWLEELKRLVPTK